MRFARYFVAVLCVLICIMSTSCSIWNFGYEIQEREYYLNKNNFVPVTAVCVEIVTNEWFPGQYFINVKDMVYEETENCKFISVSFEVDKANSAILKDAKIDE